MVTRRLMVLVLTACGAVGSLTDDGGGPEVADGVVVDADRAAHVEASGGAQGLSPGTCPAGVVCVATFPFTDRSDTSSSSARTLDRYACAATTNESGPERVYRVTVPAAGFLSAAVYEEPGVDVDVHILSALDAAACVARGNLHAKADVGAGTWWVVVDTYGASAGRYRVDIGFVVPSRGPCGMQTGLMERVNDNGSSLPMPATGKMAVEAHLVTQEEPPPYPATARDELEAHWALSQERTRFVMHRSQVWAPLEGGTFYGAGIGSPALLPVEHEGWYVNMYWRSTSRPARGTRMIVRAPGGASRAVVVAAGYETGPGDLTWVGGTPEETHFYMGTGHGGVMTIGIAADQALPLGPRECSP